jgi:cell division septation protein DedD
MLKSILARRSMVTAALLGLGVGAFCSVHVRAQEDKAKSQEVQSHDVMMPMSPDEQKAAMDELEKFKQMAGDPQQQGAMKAGLARLMVMEEMSKMMSTDPQFQPAALAFLKDPNVKKLHDQAENMSMDPEQMKKMEADITADPKAMHMVLYRALQLAMPPEPAPTGVKK